VSPSDAYPSSDEAIEYVLRYDLLSAEGYKFIDEYGLDSGDDDGILQGKVGIELFVHFTDKNTVNGYICYYLNAKNRKTIEYIAHADGSVSVNEID
jgi:hypothetical protein